MLSLIHKGNSLVAIYSNRPTPNESPYKRRKSNSEMLKNYSNTFNIDLSKSLLKSNRLTDLITGNKAIITYLIPTKKNILE